MFDACSQLRWGVLLSRGSWAQVDSFRMLNWVRNLTPQPMSSLEGILSSAAEAAIGMHACLMAIMTDSIAPAKLLAKYRPGVPIIVVTQDPAVASHASLVHGIFPMLVSALLHWLAPRGRLHQNLLTLLSFRKVASGEDLTPSTILDRLVVFVRASGLADLKAGDDKGDQVVMVLGLQQPMIQPDQVEALASSSRSGQTCTPSQRRRVPYWLHNNCAAGRCAIHDPRGWR